MTKKKTSSYDNYKRSLQMVRLLRENGKMKSKEIIKALGLKNTRSISIYKNNLIRLGFNIQTESGYYGGYWLKEDRLDDNELEIISYCIGKISEENFYLIDKIKKINDRI